MLRITGLRLPLTQRRQVKQGLLDKLQIEADQLISYSIFKESVDARRSHMIYFVYTVDFEVKDKSKIASSVRKQLQPTPQLHYATPIRTALGNIRQPVIIGTGPCGLFAALLLAQAGFNPLILERGADVDSRVQTVKRFWKQGILNPQTNVQFGEGGAGTFSDGKLTTNIKDPRCRYVLETLVECGAPEEILYSAKPHIGTDKLRDIVKTLRKRIEGLGGEVRFNSRVTSIGIHQGKVSGVLVDDTHFIEADSVILAMGHSARDSFQMCYALGIAMEAKPFAMGLRIEHPQQQIDKAQYGKFAGHPNLGAADYKLTYQATNGRGVYTFCMCPGGSVVAAASETGYVVTNGMSMHARNGLNANSALLVTVGVDDFNTENLPPRHPLGGLEFQRQWERKAYDAGNRTYKAPAQRVGDFLKVGQIQQRQPVTPTYQPGVVFTDLTQCLPDYVVEALRQALVYWGTKLSGFAAPQAVLTGVETRSSSPIRLLRGDDYQSVNVTGLYPAGEGAGYAGGIVSAAVDGLRSAEALIATCKK